LGLKHLQIVGLLVVQSCFDLAVFLLSNVNFLFDDGELLLDLFTICFCKIDLKRQLEEIKQQLAIVEQEIHVRQEEHRQIETTLHNKQTDYLQMLEAQPALLGVLKRK
jgi:septal ring factor EnvC (AmiA/AmiB activator)